MISLEEADANVATVITELQPLLDLYGTDEMKRRMAILLDIQGMWMLTWADIDADMAELENEEPDHDMTQAIAIREFAHSNGREALCAFAYTVLELLNGDEYKNIRPEVWHLCDLLGESTDILTAVTDASLEVLTDGESEQ